MVKRINKALDSENRDAGFTLIELLVVIIIIGILAAIAIPVFLNQRKKGVDSATKADVKNLSTMAESVATDDPMGAPGAAGYYTTTGTAASNIVAAGAKKSEGTVLDIKGSPSTGFCIRGYNAGGSLNAAGAAVYFDSQGGGLTTGAQPTTGACGVVAGNGSVYVTIP